MRNPLSSSVSAGIAWSPGCYFFFEEFKSWNSSQEYCASRFSDLITIDDQNEKDLVETVAKNSLYTWIGLRYSDITMDWRWMNGSRLQTGR
ncbi:hypothetical protein NDU88_004963 [Pleurodeles waltl]|uniref:C-type lectin domain-containing protein n=1 Tax=Pleurodeles waltl TaxID=8319 RepID=A0AAV7V2L3_PLEWA|nr:hypothetical protein NDU88_004963 [Pleurodeles waltl]